MTRQPAPRYVSVEAVAKYFDVSRMTVYRRIHDGELPAIRVGRSIRIPVSALNDYTRHAAIQAGAEDMWTPVSGGAA